jgi:hypothetical protein
MPPETPHLANRMAFSIHQQGLAQITDTTQVLQMMDEYQADRAAARAPSDQAAETSQ